MNSPEHNTKYRVTATVLAGLGVFASVGVYKTLDSFTSRANCMVIAPELGGSVMSMQGSKPCAESVGDISTAEPVGNFLFGSDDYLFNVEDGVMYPSGS
jgi:hypothetical protein